MLAAQAYGDGMQTEDSASRTPRIAYAIRQKFRKTYGAAFDSGLIGAGLLADLLRGIAFAMLASQDNGINELITNYEDALLIVEVDLRNSAVLS